MYLVSTVVDVSISNRVQVFLAVFVNRGVGSMATGVPVRLVWGDSEEMLYRAPSHVGDLYF